MVALYIQTFGLSSREVGFSEDAVGWFYEDFRRDVAVVVAL